MTTEKCTVCTANAKDGICRTCSEPCEACECVEFYRDKTRNLPGKKKAPKPAAPPREACTCGRPLIARVGDLEATCGECRGRPDSCDCDPVRPAAKADRPARRLVLTPASEIQPEPVVWAWEDKGAGRIPAGSFGLFAGREGTGKSSFLIRLAAEVTKGELDGAFKGEPRAVMYAMPRR